MDVQVDFDKIVFDVRGKEVFHRGKHVYTLATDHQLPDHIELCAGDVIVYPIDDISCTVLKIYRRRDGIYCALIITNEVVHEYVSIYSLAVLTIDKYRFCLTETIVLS